MLAGLAKFDMKTVLNKVNYDVTKQPMFLGKDLGIQRYDKFKYPKFYELFLKQEEQNWSPMEISLLKDRGDYEKLEPTERFIFENNLKWQTMTDSMLQRSIHKISEYVTLPELEICLATWARFENIHSLSYTWILQNITKNASAFFDSILDDKEIVTRAKHISAAYDNLLGNPNDIKEKIFQAILATQITEGLSFYVSFACAFWFGFRGKMVGNADIVKLIAKDESLHLGITQNILRYWKTNADEGFQSILEKNEDLVYETYKTAVKHEEDWANYLFSKGSLIGLNPEILTLYIKWLADNRLQSLGYKKLYNIKTNPIGGWLDSYLDETKLQVAPQEKEITTYKIAAQTNDLDDVDFKGFKL